MDKQIAIVLLKIGAIITAGIIVLPAVLIPAPATVRKDNV